jgi:hypothetical protein
MGFNFSSILPLSPAMTPPLAAEFSNDFSEEFTI